MSAYVGKSRTVRLTNAEIPELADGEYIDFASAVPGSAVMSGDEMTKERTQELVVSLIKAWNIKDDQDQDLPISLDSLLALDFRVFVALTNRFRDLITLPKASSGASEQPSAPDAEPQS